ncbi:MAG TPA: cob(I)yrinic acid a,c-diamide adenosyltransferase [Candidatus Xenobia bacterium]|jgi:cob(I)alamin adenosyltransferase
MSIYTRSGDDGTTVLLDGERVSKNHDRIEAYGCLEELNAHLGLALEHLRDSPPNVLYRAAPCLTRVQNELLDLASEMATPPRILTAVAIQMAQVEAMERLMDRCEADLPPLKSWLLPGGGLASAALHVARAVCRRTERAVLRLAQREAVRPEGLMYLNRLGDLLFVLARWIQLQTGMAEVPWITRTAPEPVTVAEQPPVDSVGFRRVY